MIENIVVSFAAPRNPEPRHSMSPNTFSQVADGYRRMPGLRSPSLGSVPSPNTYHENATRKSRSITLPVSLERSMGLSSVSSMEGVNDDKQVRI